MIELQPSILSLQQRPGPIHLLLEVHKAWREGCLTVKHQAEILYLRYNL